MFRFVVGVVLVGFLYLGFEFVAAYKDQNTSVAETSVQTQQDTHSIASEADGGFLKRTLATPFGELGTFHEKLIWIFSYAMLGLVTLGLFLVLKRSLTNRQENL